LRLTGRPALKVGGFRIVGTSPRRLDIPDKVTGACQYGIDTMVPGMKAVRTKDVTLGNVPDIEQSVVASGGRLIQAVCQVQMLHHAAMEPIAMVASWRQTAWRCGPACRTRWAPAPRWPRLPAFR
jgi:hypothetical protein